MATALDDQFGAKHASRIEYIELREYSSSKGVMRATDDRRLSNRVVPLAINASRIVKQDFFKIWQSVRKLPCELTDISFGGIGLRSKDLLRINDIVNISLSAPACCAEQTIPVRIRNHYLGEDGTYSYGGTLEHLLNADFRRLIVQQLTSKVL